VVVQHDLRQPDVILADPQVRALLDFDRPVAVLMMAVLHFVSDADDPVGVIRRLREATVPGSYLVISHGTQDALSDEVGRIGRDLFAQTSTPYYPRTRAEVLRLFDGFDLVEPGLVWTVQWRPEHPDEVGETPQRSAAYAGVGRRH
jgi:hypothetical protein